ncbi:hypothetical protein J7T55_015359 [Diaporthe amygdali]|uniref:uncharacterized protein n=1 Tax=Phomopsis amygdali TaxID=1214568 RepID=UPI0022FE8030|nr:uncharacterized protein J7T55_015359 [Diaporthe amygdali]KAJ0120629.1 hypothetical protein J7T55_015359 [Diaporthe amygdali]
MPWLRPNRRQRIDQELPDAINEWRNQLEEADLSEQEAAEFVNGFEAGIPAAEAAVANSPGGSSASLAGGTVGGFQTQIIQSAANLATFGLGPDVMIQTLINAGVPASEAPRTFQEIQRAMDEVPEFGPGRPAYHAALGVISNNVVYEGAHVAEAVQATLRGESVPSLHSRLSSAGVPDDALDGTVSAMDDAIQAAQASGSDVFNAGLDVIRDAASPVSPYTESGSLAGLNVVGATYTFWYVFPKLLWGVMTKLEDKSHSKRLEEALALGPPPEPVPWINITFPYERSSALPAPVPWPPSPTTRTSSPPTRTSSPPTMTSSPPTMTSSPPTRTTSSTLTTPSSTPTTPSSTSATPSPTKDPEPAPPLEDCSATTTSLTTQYFVMAELYHGLSDSFRHHLDFIADPTEKWITYYDKVIAWFAGMQANRRYKPDGFTEEYIAFLRINRDHIAKSKEIVEHSSIVFQSLVCFEQSEDTEVEDACVEDLRSHPDKLEKARIEVRDEMCKVREALENGEAPGEVSPDELRELERILTELLKIKATSEIADFN